MRDNAGRPSAMGLWVGYLPLVVVCALVAAMVVMIPSEVPGSGVATGEARRVSQGQTATGWDATVSACTDRERQVETDGYSPPCFQFSGDNGGETSAGVTADTVRIGYRVTADPHLLVLLARAAGYPFDESPEDLVRTAEGLIDYFNQHYQFYGRQLEMVQVEGQGSLLTEFTGGGREDARSDALRTSEANVFADVTGLTQPYAEALSREHIVNVGAPYMSREWFQAQRPYSWSNFPDCTVAAETAVNYGVSLVFGQPARFAGGDLANRERRVGVVAPNNREYQQCVDVSERIAEEAGFEFALREDYVLDIAQIQAQATSILGELRRSDITSIACGCDPLMMLYLSTLAEQQGYHPEWLNLGVGFTDLDLVGQIIASQSGSQMSRAFGGSPWGAAVPNEQSLGYQAYKSVRDDEPSQLVDIVYAQLYQVVIGIQMAGPNLTPETFETGMFAYPGGNGQFGLWDFSEGHYTGVADAREIWWDPDTPSPFNGRPGTFRDDGTRWEQDQPPEQSTAFQEQGS
jgi:substrate-binding family protein